MVSGHLGVIEPIDACAENDGFYYFPRWKIEDGLVRVPPEASGD